jgi:hypothetical protein
LEIGDKVDPGSYEFSVCRDYQNGTKRGYLFLDAFNTNRAADPGPGGTPTPPYKGFSGVNATIDSVEDSGDCGGEGGVVGKETIVQITKGAGQAYVLWGGHLASPLDPGVGDGNGASSWPGASLHMRVNEDLAIKPEAIGPPAAPSAIHGDVTGDGRVTSADVAGETLVWLLGTQDPRYDVNHDGTVDWTDLSIVILQWWPLGTPW